MHKLNLIDSNELENRGNSKNDFEESSEHSTSIASENDSDDNHESNEGQESDKFSENEVSPDDLENDESNEETEDDESNEETEADESNEVSEGDESNEVTEGDESNEDSDGDASTEETDECSEDVRKKVFSEPKKPSKAILGQVNSTESDVQKKNIKVHFQERIPIEPNSKSGEENEEEKKYSNLLRNFRGKLKKIQESEERIHELKDKKV